MFVSRNTFCARKNKYLIPKIYCVPGNIFNYILCHRNIFNLPGFLFYCPDFSFCSPKTFLCSTEIEVYPPEFYLLPRKYLVHPIYFVSHALIFFDSSHFGQAVMPWLLNDPDPAASALYTEFQTQAFSDILLNSTNDNTPRKHTTTVAAGDDEGRLLAWKTAQETSTGHGNTSWLVFFLVAFFTLLI